MNRWRSALLSIGVAALGACGGTKACLKAQPYQASVPGPQIKAPEDLDDLQPLKEASIPDVSPGASTGNPSA